MVVQSHHNLLSPDDGTVFPSTSSPQPFALNLLPSTSRVEFSESAGVRHCRLENSHKRAPFARLLLRVTNSCVSKLEMLTFCTCQSRSQVRIDYFAIFYMEVTKCTSRRVEHAAK